MHNLLATQQAGKRPGVYDKEISDHLAMQMLKSKGQRGQQTRLTEGDCDMLAGLNQSTMTQEEARILTLSPPPPPPMVYVRHAVTS